MSGALDRRGTVASRAAVVLAVALLAGCAAAPSRDDPFEPMNRTLYQFHDTVDTAVVKPVAQAYIDVVPRAHPHAASRTSSTISTTSSRRSTACCRASSTSSATTSAGWCSIPHSASAASSTSRRWSASSAATRISARRSERGAFPQGPYLFVPFFGPTTVRDGTGVVVRIAVGPVGYIPDVALRNSLYGLGAIDLRAQALSAGAIVDTAALDRYLFIRNAYLQRRRYLVYDGKPPPEPEEP